MMIIEVHRMIVLAIGSIFIELELCILNIQFQFLSKTQSKNFIFILQMKKLKYNFMSHLQTGLSLRSGGMNPSSSESIIFHCLLN